MNRTRRALGRAALLLSACGSDGILGEDLCYGDKTLCDSDVPTYDLGSSFVQVGPYAPLRGLHTDAEPMPGLSAGDGSFDLRAEGMLEPRWVYECPRERCLYGQFSQLQPAPEGVWLATPHGNPNLIRLTTHGEELEFLRLEPKSGNASGPFELSVDERLQPSLGYFQPATVRAGWFRVEEEHGALQAASLSVLPLKDAKPSFFVAGPEGRQLLRVEEGGRAAVYAYGPSGRLQWKQSYLRDSNSLSDHDSLRMGRALVFASGNLVFLASKERIDVEGGPEPVVGLTVLDPDGNMLWDAVGATGASRHLLARGNDGTFAFAYVDAGEDLSVGLYGEDATYHAFWQGRRVDYHSVAPQAVAVDPAGNVYVKLTTGPRDEPLPTLCRLPAEKTQVPRCVGLEVSARADFFPQGVYSIAAPEPNLVIAVVDRSDGDAHPLSVMRFDFEK